jgi:2-isopropylmalate synthase
MKQIKITDITLREESAAPSFSLSFKEKIELARELDKLGIDVIETAPITDEKTDALLVRTISSLVKHAVLSCPTGLTADSVAAAWNAIMGAAHPRMLVSIPVSTVQMEYLCHRKPKQVLELIPQLVGTAAKLCADVEFAAEDATRADPEFLGTAIDCAIAAGARTVTLCDTAGTMLPEEFSAFIAGLYARVPALRDVALSVQCSDELGMAAACAFASVAAGAGQIKAAVGASAYPTLESIAHVIRTRGVDLDISCALNMTGLGRALKRMTYLVSTERSASSPFDNGAGGTSGTQDIALDGSADITQVAAAVSALGYELSGDDLAKVYEAFGRIAVKKQVGAKELETIVASTALQVPPTYKITSYVINSGNIISPTANIQLEKDGRALRGLSVGDGPIDAAFLAIEQIIGHHYELDEFQIQAVTEGREAMGSALVKLRSAGKLFSGQGISTDIIGAAIRAYVDALNKIVYEENLK